VCPCDIYVCMYVHYICTLQGHVVTVCEDSSLHLWRLDIKDELSQLNHVRTIPADTRSVVCDRLAIRLTRLQPRARSC